MMNYLKVEVAKMSAVYFLETISPYYYAIEADFRLRNNLLAQIS